MAGRVDPSYCESSRSSAGFIATKQMLNHQVVLRESEQGGG